MSTSFCYRIGCGLLLFALAQAAPEAPEASSTQQMKTTVREWIETMREIQQEENDWERDRTLLYDQRDALKLEIDDLEKMLERARASKASAEKDVTDEIEKRDSLLAAQDTLGAQVPKLEARVLPLIAQLPAPIIDEPRNRTLINEIRDDAKREGEEKKKDLTKRLNNVLNLLAKAEEWQQTVHLRDELHTDSQGNEKNFHVMYFGLAIAYAVDQSGQSALVGRPGENGWSFEERPKLATDILTMKNVLTGDADPQFITLPVDLK